MIRVFTFIIIILVIYGFHKYYKNKEDFDSSPVYTKLDTIFADAKLGLNNQFDDTVHEYGSYTKEKSKKIFPGCINNHELKKNIDFFNWWKKCGEECEGGKYWTDGACNCLCVPISTAKKKLNYDFEKSLKYWSKL